MSAEHSAVVRRVVEDVLNAGDFDAADDLIAPDVINHNSVPGIPADRAGAKRVFTKLREAFPDLRFTIEDLLTDGDRVVVRWSGTGTHERQFVALPPTGKQITVNGMDMVRIADGKIVERWGYYDQVGLMRQLDLMPVPARESAD